MEESGTHKLEDAQTVDFETGDGIARENVTEENSEPVKETNDSDGSNLSTHVVDVEKVEEDKVLLDSVVEVMPSLDSVNPVVSLSEELAQVAEDVVQNLGASAITEEDSKKIMPLTDDTDGVSSIAPDFLSKETEPSLVENDGVSPAVTDSTLKGVEEAIFPVSDENVGESSRADDLVSKEAVANLLQPADVPGVAAGNGGENCDMSEVPKNIENQLFIAATPQRRTSWMGCCGLFDVFRGTNQ